MNQLTIIDELKCDSDNKSLKHELWLNDDNDINNINYGSVICCRIITFKYQSNKHQCILIENGSLIKTNKNLLHACLQLFKFFVSLWSWMFHIYSLVSKQNHEIYSHIFAGVCSIFECMIERVVFIWTFVRFDLFNSCN